MGVERTVIIGCARRTRGSKPRELPLDGGVWPFRRGRLTRGDGRFHAEPGWAGSGCQEVRKVGETTPLEGQRFAIGSRSAAAELVAFLLRDLGADTSLVAPGTRADLADSGSGRPPAG